MDPVSKMQCQPYVSMTARAEFALTRVFQQFSEESSKQISEIILIVLVLVIATTWKVSLPRLMEGNLYTFLI